MRAFNHDGSATRARLRILWLEADPRASRPDGPATGADAAVRAVITPRAIPVPSIVDPRPRSKLSCCRRTRCRPGKWRRATGTLRTTLSWHALDLLRVTSKNLSFG